MLSQQALIPPLLLATLLLAAVPAQGGSAFSGIASVVDGDTIWVDRRKVRLAEIDAFESRQTCPNRHGHPTHCGRRATIFLKQLAQSKRVACRFKENDRYGRSVAFCSVEGEDLGAVMVRAGHAVAYISKRYKSLEQGARAARRGAWAAWPYHKFTRPNVWRRQDHRQRQGRGAPREETNQDRRGWLPMFGL